MSNIYDEIKDLAPSVHTAAKTIYASLIILKEAGGQLPSREIIDLIPKKVTLNEYELGLYEKTGYVRWISIFRFYSINAEKSGYIRKSKRIWYLTDEGEKAISLGPKQIIESITKGYRQWDLERKKNKDTEHPDSETETGESSDIETNDNKFQKAKLDELEERAIEDIKEFIYEKNPYEFQDLIAVLLKAMGYYVPYVAPRGKDGGIDLIAYVDPLGVNVPRIKVQIKHKPDTTIPPSDIRALTGLLNKDGDVGIFVTSGYFSRESERFARDSHIHIKLIDIDMLITLWREYYNKMNDNDKNMLPLYNISFLGSNE